MAFKKAINDPNYYKALNHFELDHSLSEVTKEGFLGTFSDDDDKLFALCLHSLIEFKSK